MSDVLSTCYTCYTFTKGRIGETCRSKTMTFSLGVVLAWAIELEAVLVAAIQVVEISQVVSLRRFEWTPPAQEILAYSCNGSGCLTGVNSNQARKEPQWQRLFCTLTPSENCLWRISRQGPCWTFMEVGMEKFDITYFEPSTVQNMPGNCKAFVGLLLPQMEPLFQSPKSAVCISHWLTQSLPTLTVSPTFRVS